MSSPFKVVAQAMRRARSVPLSRYIAQRQTGWAGPRQLGARGAIMIPEDTEFSMTADHVVYEEREPTITPLGILDHRGMMLLRVTVPIKQPIGFHLPPGPRHADEVETILPEDMLAVSDIGVGIGYLTPDEVEDDDEDGEDPDAAASAETIEKVIRAALEKTGGDPAAAKALLADLGFDVEFEIRSAGADK